MAWCRQILIDLSTNDERATGTSAAFCPYQIMIQPEIHPTIRHLKQKIKHVFNITDEVYIFQVIHNATSFLPDNEDVTILHPSFNEKHVMVTTDQRIVKNILRKVPSLESFGLTIDDPESLEEGLHLEDEQTQLPMVTFKEMTCVSSGDFQVSPSASKGAENAPECPGELVITNAEKTLDVGNTTPHNDSKNPQPRKRPSKSLSVGEFLCNLREKMATDLSETGESISSPIDIPVKRKRVRRHKKTKKESSPVEVRSPLQQRIAPIFNGKAKSTRVVFPDSDDEDLNPTITGNGQGLQCQGTEGTKESSPVEVRSPRQQRFAPIFNGNAKSTRVVFPESDDEDLKPTITGNGEGLQCEGTEGTIETDLPTNESVALESTEEHSHPACIM